jgi:hypothetical protein
MKFGKLLLACLIVTAPLAANAKHETAARKPVNSFTTVSYFADGGMATDIQPISDWQAFYDAHGMTMPAATAGQGAAPPMPPPPSQSSVPGYVGRVTYVGTNAWYTRTTTYSRGVTYGSDGTYTSGPWTLTEDHLSSSSGAGGGHCNPNQEICPISVE